MLYHLHDDDEVSSVVRDDGPGPYGRLHLGTDLIVFGHAPELRRLYRAVGEALEGLTEWFEEVASGEAEPAGEAPVRTTGTAA